MNSSCFPFGMVFLGTLVIYFEHSGGLLVLLLSSHFTYRHDILTRTGHSLPFPFPTHPKARLLCANVIHLVCFGLYLGTSTTLNPMHISNKTSGFPIPLVQFAPT